MQIEYYGDYCFKITTKPAGRATEDVVIFTDPCGKEVGLRAPFGRADIILLSHMNREDGDISGLLKEEPVILDAPGEYAAKGVTALGFSSYRDDKNGSERGANTVFVFESEGIHVCYLGAIGHDLPSELLEKMNGVDILFLPVGGGDTVSPKLSDDIIRKVEPKIAIPMHYKTSGMTGSFGDMKAFCTEAGYCPEGKITKLSLKKKDLEGKNMEIITIDRE